MSTRRVPSGGAVAISRRMRVARSSAPSGTARLAVRADSTSQWPKAISAASWQRSDGLVRTSDVVRP